MLITLDLTVSRGSTTYATQKAVNDYMKKHPHYNPNKDPYIKGFASLEFADIRTEFWKNRAQEAGVCKVCIAEASHLMAYYDYGRKHMLNGWDASRIEWDDVGWDAASAILSVVALNPVAKSLKLSGTVQDVAAGGESLISLGTGAKSYREGDAGGFFLDAAGFVPGIPGIVASITSVFHDLSKAMYLYEYQPSIPR